MKTKREAENFARTKLKEYVDGCECDSREDVVLSLKVLAAVCLDALKTVQTGKIEVVQ